MGGICVDLAKTKFSNTLMLRGGSFEVVCVCVCVHTIGGGKQSVEVTQ